VGSSKKNELKPWLKEQWCIPPKANAAFVYHMEDVLSVYQRPYDERFPQVCLDELSKQLLKDKRAGLPVRPGEVEKEDYEYEREGVCNVFVACEPLAGKRFTKTTQRRTKVDWAEFVRDLIEVQYPQAEKIILVQDNLNTHSCASFYEAFAPEEAWRLAQKLEIHYTPKHGSWLNMAEIELSVLARQCLNARIDSIEEVRKQVQAWQDERNSAQVGVNWRFRTADARIKLKRLYPSIEA
jgi:DDE superfamily endonuclease